MNTVKDFFHCFLTHCILFLVSSRKDLYTNHLTAHQHRRILEFRQYFLPYFNNHNYFCEKINCSTLNEIFYFLKMELRMIVNTTEIMILVATGKIKIKLSRLITISPGSLKKWIFGVKTTWKKYYYKMFFFFWWESSTIGISLPSQHMFMRILKIFV